MSRMRGILLLCFMSLAFICGCVNAYGATVFTISNIPPAREVVIVPRGYSHCDMVPAGFIHGHWVNAYRACDYHRGRWVAAHWECLAYDRAEGICMRWNWVPEHWVPRHRYY